MIAENEMVLYGSHGVCRVAGTVTREFDGKEALYYVLEPVFAGAFTVFVPVDSPAVSAKMRRILTSDEIHEMIRKMPEEEPLAFDDPTQQKAVCTQILRSGDRRELIRLIKTLHQRQKARREQHKKPCVQDDRFMKEAERQLYDEFAFVLNLFLQTGEDFLFEELFCRFRFYGEQLAVDGDADALLTVSGAESRRQIDLIAYVVGCDQLLQLIHDFLRAFQVAGTSDTYRDFHIDSPCL